MKDGRIDDGSEHPGAGSLRAHRGAGRLLHRQGSQRGSGAARRLRRGAADLAGPGGRSGAAGPGRDRDDRSGDPVGLLVHRVGAAPGGSLGRGVGAQPLGLARHRCRGADPDGPRAACAADLARRLRMSATTPTSSTAPSRGARGFEAVLVIIYGLIAPSATARSLVQILRGFDAAPVAYSLSLVAALTYIAGTVLLVRRSEEHTSELHSRGHV